MTDATMLDLFSPPEGMVGHSCVLVAMTAGEDFLEEVLVRFTGLSARRRTELGLISVYLMLDPHASASRQNTFQPGRIPGLHEFQPRAVDPRSLLHAKVALMAFAATRAGPPSHIRFSVFTGNFTYASARHQLELVWTVDLPLDGTAPAVDRADVITAGAFIAALMQRRYYRDEQHVAPEQRHLTARLDQLLGAVSALPPSTRIPRICHSLDRPLYEQIKSRIRGAIDAPRNFLLCGSGFYESPGDAVEKPGVLAELEKLGVFTANYSRIALVEPNEAGALAAWAKSGETEGWEVRRPIDALNTRRRLHAKFIYVGYRREECLSNGCLYLGSGNLSRRGLFSKGSMPDGNLELGVVFPVPERLEDEDYAHLLFFDEDESIRPDEWRTDSEGDTPTIETMLEPSPILSATLAASPTPHLLLEWRDDFPQKTAIQARWIGHEWSDLPSGGPEPLAPGEHPSVLQVRLKGQLKEWTVPVIDAAGRVCWQPRPPSTFADALASLLDFPMRPAEAEDDPRDDPSILDPNTDPGTQTGQSPEHEKTYALHAAAELIEQVASLQKGLTAVQLQDWLEHLDRMLQGGFPAELIDTWREHHLNPFVHLAATEFRPAGLTPSQQARYRSILDSASVAWRLA